MTNYDRGSTSWNLKMELAERRQVLEARAAKAADNSHAWHQLQGQLLELDHIVNRLVQVFG